MATEIKQVQKQEQEEPVVLKLAALLEKLDVEVDELNEILVKQGYRIVGLTDVTVNRELLVKALVKYAGIPGNEVRAKADKMLKLIVGEGDEGPASKS